MITLLKLLIPSLIQGAEAIFNKPKSGPDKLSTVVQALQAYAQKYIALNPGTETITDDVLKGMVELVLEDLKSKNQLTPPPPIQTRTLYLVEGGIITQLRPGVV